MDAAPAEAKGEQESVQEATTKRGQKMKLRFGGEADGAERDARAAGPS